MDKFEVAHWAAQHIPFVALAVEKSPPNRPLLTRLSEQTLVALISAGIALYVNNAVLNTQFTQLTKEVQALTVTVNEMKRDLYVPRAGAQK